MCFAPQPSALFRHLNFQKWSEREAFLAFYSIFTSKRASHHNSVQFFMSHLTTWLRTRRSGEPTFRPSRATNHWKNTVNRAFRAPASSFFSLFLFSDLLTSWLLLSDSPHLSEVSLLNFLRLDTHHSAIQRCGKWCNAIEWNTTWYDEIQRDMIYNVR